MLTTGEATEHETRGPPGPLGSFLAAVPSRRTRLAVAVAIGALFAAHTLGIAGSGVSDLDQILFAARAVLRGENPYLLVGPGRAFQWPWELFYPLPAAIVVAPLTLLSTVAARAVFIGLSSAALAYAVSADGWHRMPLFASASMLSAAEIVQWSPLLTASALLPALGMFLVAKPNVGLALWVARPSRAAAIGGAVLLIGSALLFPWWPRAWLQAATHGEHFRAPVAFLPYGPLLLLALLRWRRPEARLLLALGCLPHNVVLYEALPLFLIPATVGESITLALLSQVVMTLTMLRGPHGFAEYLHVTSPLVVLLLYLPCLVMILRRGPETPADPARSRRARGVISEERAG